MENDLDRCRVHWVHPGLGNTPTRDTGNVWRFVQTQSGQMSAILALRQRVGHARHRQAGHRPSSSVVRWMTRHFFWIRDTQSDPTRVRSLRYGRTIPSPGELAKVRRNSQSAARSRANSTRDAAVLVPGQTPRPGQTAGIRRLVTTGWRWPRSLEALGRIPGCSSSGNCSSARHCA